jgi:hypothetical protein
MKTKFSAMPEANTAKRFLAVVLASTDKKPDIAFIHTHLRNVSEGISSPRRYVQWSSGLDSEKLLQASEKRKIRTSPRANEDRREDRRSTRRPNNTKPVSLHEIIEALCT